MQRKLGWMAALVMVVGCGPREAPYASPSPAPVGGGAYASPSPAAISPISGEFAAEVVAVDAAARTVTLRESAVGGMAAASPASNVTLNVEGDAGNTLRDFKAGDRVVVSCLLTGAVGATGAAAAPATGLAGCTSVTAIRKAI
jgi:hypothetical protein